MQERNLEWVQMLRGIAAVLVVLTHARYALLGTADWPAAEMVFLPGAMGVDLFFVISGFIMYYSTAQSSGGPRAAAQFFIKRFARVWPAYAVVTLAFVLVVHEGFGYVQSQTGNLLRSLFFIPVDPKAAPYFAMALPLGWTLAFEMYFYLVFAASLLFKRLRWFVLAAWVLLTVVLLPLPERGFDMDVTRDLGYGWRYMAVVANPFVLEFFTGVVIGWIHGANWPRLINKEVARQVMLVGCGVAAWMIYSGLTIMHGPTRWGWPVAILFLSLAVGSRTIELRPPRLLLWLGTISYSLYLTHTLTQHLTKLVLIKTGKEAFTHTWGFIFLSTVLAIPLASLVHRWVEQDLSAWLRRKLLKGLELLSTTRDVPLVAEQLEREPSKRFKL